MPKKIRVTLSNDFHNSEVDILVDPDQISEYETDLEVAPTLGQLRRVRRELCGFSDCTCGGVRGPQQHDGRTLHINTYAEYR